MRELSTPHHIFRLLNSLFWGRWRGRKHHIGIIFWLASAPDPSNMHFYAFLWFSRHMPSLRSDDWISSILLSPATNSFGLIGCLVLLHSLFDRLWGNIWDDLQKTSLNGQVRRLLGPEPFGSDSHSKINLLNQEQKGWEIIDIIKAQHFAYHVIPILKAVSIGAR